MSNAEKKDALALMRMVPPANKLKTNRIVPAGELCSRQERFLLAKFDRRAT